MSRPEDKKLDSEPDSSYPKWQETLGDEYATNRNLRLPVGNPKGEKKFLIDPRVERRRQKKRNQRKRGQKSF